ncbi:sugar porter family MFS transporter [Balneola sp. MJW-20]|uniref:sugar porter family MFS transporter n=1 Tax=Gracilimonas aurantiaca TaxID=3234185 RepID=UPI003466497E
MNSRYLLLISSVAALGGFLFGYDTGVINGSQFYFSKYFDLSAAMKGWVVGSALIGCFIGAVVSGPLSRKTGRKNSLIISAVLFVLSAWGSGLPSFLPESVSLLVIFRLIGGMGIGLASMNAPTYIAELSPADIRGKMVTVYQMAIVFGFFLVFLVTYFIGSSSDELYNLNDGWRVMFWSELVPAGLFFGLLFTVPKSPRWLMLNDRKDEARKVLTKVHGSDLAALEIIEIKESIKGEEGISLAGIFKKSILPIVLIGSVISGLQQFTGINAVLYYGADIFEKALGFGQEDVLAQQILLAGVNVIFTFLAMYTVDKWGRKPLIITGSVGMITGFLMLGLTLMYNQVGLISLLGILIFIASFAMSMGPVVWVMLSEMFPNEIRSVAMSVAVAVQWACNYIVSQSFPVVVESQVNGSAFWNGSLPYFIFIGFIAVIIWFTVKYIPETKGRSLEKIEKIWEERFGTI